MNATYRCIAHRPEARRVAEFQFTCVDCHMLLASASVESSETISVVESLTYSPLRCVNCAERQFLLEMQRYDANSTGRN